MRESRFLIREIAQKVLARLQQLGADARLIEIPGGALVVYGEIGVGKRTLMIYDHYDVQPPESLELWETALWDAAIRDSKLSAAGKRSDVSAVPGAGNSGGERRLRLVRFTRAPNESIRIVDYFEGMFFVRALIDRFAAM